ncbi:VRR-NUC domain-containing protein [Marinomonas ostreistagni]|uniref:VRR-NUC domain-containing protein n=1 Tax=Marinomonas ostreistagni TaxID=359209 RepID=UPI00195001F3|nr:VRR-NUC domain-containing protein [Marinomonas ostreistagni]MBM6551748.1 VRR-NUC domain-containing protein [Marinomonas ostreistagni]
MSDSRFKSASLSQQTYYLDNAKSVWRWVLNHHSDLLTDSEVATLEGIFNLAPDAQALLTRLIMRRGELFDSERLHYPEIADISAAITQLGTQHYITLDPLIGVASLCHKATKEQLAQVIQHQDLAPLNKSSAKALLRQHLEQTFPSDMCKSFSQWGMPGTWVELQQPELFARIQLMFFGNLHQDWSEFIVTELGHIQYETVELTPQSRAFQSRQEIDTYLQLEVLRQALDNGAYTDKQHTILLHTPFENPWLEKRRQRLCFLWAQQLEKQGEPDSAMQYYRCTLGNHANVRYLRLLERSATPQDVVAQAHQLLEKTSHQETYTLLQRVLHRAQKKLGQSIAKTTAFIPKVRQLTLVKDTQSVERAVADYLQQQSPRAPVYYVENLLLPALWALLYWEVIYAPVPGAFFHPFQSSPKDLYSDQFFSRRQAPLMQVQQALEDGTYRDLIQQRFAEKYGISCRFIYWPALTQELLGQALTCISVDALSAIFDYLMQDLKHHKKGLPDLIRFDPSAQNFELIEVKAPNDRLQEQQTLWLQHFAQHDIDAWVAKVTWQD